MVVLQLAKIHVPPGQRVVLRQVGWQQFESILAEMGEHRATRLAYSKGTLEIVVPLPEHEQTKVVIADLLKVLLDEFDRDWEPLGSTTVRREDMQALIEPDECFYIQNHSQPSSTRAELHECFKHNRGTVLGSLLYLCYAQLQQGTRLKGEG